jgi:hypothetical protein
MSDLPFRIGLTLFKQGNVPLPLHQQTRKEDCQGNVLKLETTYLQSENPRGVTSFVNLSFSTGQYKFLFMVLQIISFTMTSNLPESNNTNISTYQIPIHHL